MLTAWPSRVATRTNDNLRSTMHRVVNKLGRERYSVAYFFEPDFDTEASKIVVGMDTKQQTQTCSKGWQGFPPLVYSAGTIRCTLFVASYAFVY